MEAKLQSLVYQFIDYYGLNGTIVGRNVVNFLSSLYMDRAYMRQLTTQGKCPGHNFSSESWYRHENLSSLLVAVWETAQTPACHSDRPGGLAIGQDEKAALLENGGGNLPIQVWGYGLLSVTVINLCAALGVLFIPFMGSRIYRLLMTFMTSLAVGSLLATALLILVPDSLQLPYIHEELNSEHSVLNRFHLGAGQKAGWELFLATHPWYIWRCCAVFGGICLFFWLERLLKELLGYKGLAAPGDGHSHGPGGASPPPPPPQTLTSSGTAISIPMMEETGLHATTAAEIDAAGHTVLTPLDQNAATKQLEPPTSPDLRSRLKAVQPVAWMILLGDALHNFIDGLSIGAGFSRSTLTGFGISLAVLCEELPHELGDFAILLGAGMSVPMAVVSNLLSAFTCYAGFILGVMLGEVPGVGVWIFAVGGGMFLYISLVDMMPEVNAAVDAPESRHIGKVKIFALQNMGLFIGYGLILVIALFGGDIKFG